MTDQQAKQLSEDKFNVEIGHMNLVQGLFLNNKIEPFNNPLVRQALCYAIDRQACIDMVAGGNGTVIGSNMFPGLKNYYNKDMETKYALDKEKAKELLAQAGYPEGFEFTISTPSNYQFHVDTVQVIVEQLKAVGITAKVNLIDWSTWLSDVYADRKYQATIVGLDGNLAPKDIVRRYDSTASDNFLNYSSPEFDEVFKKAIATTDEAEKMECYKKLQEILATDAASVYIQDPAKYVAVSKKLGGYEFYPVYVQDLSSVYFVEE